MFRDLAKLVSRTLSSEFDNPDKVPLLTWVDLALNMQMNERRTIAHGEPVDRKLRRASRLLSD